MITQSGAAHNRQNRQGNPLPAAGNVHPVQGFALERKTFPLLYSFRIRPGGQGLFLVKVIFFILWGIAPKLSIASGGAMDTAFLLSALAVAWAGFCLLLSSNGKVPKIAGRPCGVLLFIAMLCTEPAFLHFCPGKSGKTRRRKPPGPQGI